MPDGEDQEEDPDYRLDESFYQVVHKKYKMETGKSTTVDDCIQDVLK